MTEKELSLSSETIASGFAREFTFVLVNLKRNFYDNTHPLLPRRSLRDRRDHRRDACKYDGETNLLHKTSQGKL